MLNKNKIFCLVFFIMHMLKTSCLYWGFLLTTEQQHRRHPSLSTALRARASHLKVLHLMTAMMMMMR